jgi:predicted transcriptional regulator
VQTGTLRVNDPLVVNGEIYGKVRVAEFLAGRKTPHPNLARMMERVILRMIGEKK